MNEFSRDEELLISKLKLLHRADHGAHIKGDLKIRLMREIAARELELARANAPVVWALPRFVVPALAITTALVVALLPVLWLSRGSMPGDLLYPAKLAYENAALFLTRDPVRQANLKASFVAERVREARAVANVTRDPASIAAALGRYEENVRQMQKVAATAERKQTSEAVAQLSGAAAALLEEATHQLAKESELASSMAISQQFVDAAGISIMVLSQFVEKIEGAEKIEGTEKR